MQLCMIRMQLCMNVESSALNSAEPVHTVYLGGRVPGRVWQATGQAIELRRVALESSASAKPHLRHRHKDTVSAEGKSRFMLIVRGLPRLDPEAMQHDAIRVAATRSTVSSHMESTQGTQHGCMATVKCAYKTRSSIPQERGAASCLRVLVGWTVWAGEVERGQGVRGPGSGLCQVLREDVQEHLVVGVHGHLQR